MACVKYICSKNINILFPAIKYTDEQEDIRRPQDTKVFKEPSKSRDVVISPFLDRVAYAKSQRIRRNQLSKSAPIRKEPLEKKTPILARPAAEVSNVNFSERANYWKTDPSAITRETKWADIKTRVFSAKPSRGWNQGQGKAAVEAPEQKLALPDSAKDSDANGNSSLVPAKESSPSQATTTTSRFSPSLRKRGITESKGRASPACHTVGFKPWTKTVPQPPKSTTKPLFSLTSLELEEDDVIRAISPIGKDKLENEQALAITESSEKKFNSTSSGIKFRDFGPSSSSQKSKTKVNVTGFGQSARKGNKGKERVNANIKLSPDVSQLALLDRAESPQGNPPFLSHYTVTKMNTGVQKQLDGPAVVSMEFTSKFTVHPSSRLEEQGFFSAGYVNKLMNRSNNSNKNVLEEQPNDSAASDDMPLMFLPNDTESFEAKVKKLLKKSKQMPPMSDDKKWKDRGDIISIPSVSMIDNYSEIDVSSDSENDDEFDDSNSTDLYRSLLDCTFSSVDASVVELDLNEASDGDIHDAIAAKDEVEGLDIADIELADASENRIQPPLRNDSNNSTDISGRHLQLFDLNDITYDSADASIDDIEIPRATLVNSRSVKGSSLDFERFLHCSESSGSDTDQSRVSPLLFSDSELSGGKTNNTNTTNILNKSRLESSQTVSHVDSSGESDRNNSLGSINKSALIWKTSRGIDMQFPPKNGSFRMAMKNPVVEMDNYVESTQRSEHTCLLDLLNDEDQDLTSFSVVPFADASKSSLSIPSDFGDDLNYDDHSYCMKTSTPIKHTMNRLDIKDDAEMHQKAIMERDSSQDISSNQSECTNEISPEFYGKSSEEDEIVEIIYTTSSSEEISNEESPKNLSTTGESLNSTRFSQISGITKGCILRDSMALASDSGLSNLNFTTMINSQRNHQKAKPSFSTNNCNVTWHPDVTRSYDSGMNQSPSPKKPKLRRSVARTNLLAKFDDTVKRDRGENECENDDADINTLIRFGNSKSPYDTLRPDAKNDEIYKVTAAPRRQRYSKNPSSSLKSQFWASRQYVEETEKAVYNLLQAEFSSPNESL